MNSREIIMVRQALSRGDSADQAALGAVATLAERLEKLKLSSSLFAGVSFSSHVEAMMSENLVSA